MLNWNFYVPWATCFYRLNDNELRQFYAAANGDFARLRSSVKKTIKWRQSYTFFSPEELEAWSPFIFWHGHDANQRPCLIIRLGHACYNLRSEGRSILIKAVGMHSLLE